MSSALDPPPENPAAESPMAQAGRPAWPPWLAWAGMVVAFGAAFAGGLAIAAVGAAFGADLDDPPPAVNILATLWQGVALVGVAVLLARAGGRAAAARELGFVRTRPLRAVGLALATWLGFLVLAAIWTQALGIDEEDTVTQQLGVDESLLAFVVVAVLVTIVAPIVEETFFRGFFFGALRNWRGPVPAALLTGAVFGAIHLGSSPAAFVVPLAIFGALLCLLYVRTGSLLPCIGVHALNNSVAFGVSEDWSWQILLLAPAAIVVCLAISGAVMRRRVA